MQKSLCSSKEELACLRETKVDTSDCVKPCSGLIITSYSKSEVDDKLEGLMPFLPAYNDFKKKTTNPSGFRGQ